MRVDATSYEDASVRIIDWANAGESRYVCVATVNNVMEAHDDPSFLTDMNHADLVTPDGMPLVWGLKLFGVSGATRVYGPDLTVALLPRLAREGIAVGFYGGTSHGLEALLASIKLKWPQLRIVYGHSPPFRELSPEEEDETVRGINASGARVLFVGLGCPKQERWMARHRGHAGAVMVGVGAAFDFLSGAKKQAPSFLQKMGLEWLFRLATEPRRLWRRYLLQNPRFVVLFSRQLIRDRATRSESSSKK
jgi:N-acetylglucosaminyldiphosphoundecaprenol N-acetyl-beta-D-mannosaminyltransferase